MPNYLFTATIPSVKKIISSSRKAEDIWAGSVFISYLIKNALDKIKAYDKVDLIFPEQLVSGSLDFGVIPNKILLVFYDSNQEDIYDIARQTENYINENIRKIVDFVFAKCKISDDKYKELAYYQVQNIVEFFWAAVEIEKDYKKAREEVENYISYLKDSYIRKDTKYQGYILITPEQHMGSFEDFQQKDNYEDYCRGAYTCTICGGNTIIGATKHDYKGNAFWSELWKGKRFKKGERLCGFCLVKRYLRDYLNRLPFPSTSEIASTLFKKQIVTEQNSLVNELYGVFEKIIDKLPKGNPVLALREKLGGNLFQNCFLILDGSWFMIDTWKNPNNYNEYEIKEEIANNIASELEKIYSKSGIFPSNMYSILKLDGDNMGAKISNLDKIEHKRLSSLQTEFTNEVKKIIKFHYGEVIYIGGDDIMAFLPVESVYKCAKQINEKLEQKMTKIRCLLLENEKYNFTLTGCILIAHHRLPLKFVLSELYDLEKETKAEKNKNSVGIKLIKHSFSSEKIILKWDKIDEFVNLRSVPKSFIYQLNSISHTLTNSDFHTRKTVMHSLLKGKVSKDEEEFIIMSILNIDSDLLLDRVNSLLKMRNLLQWGN